MRDVHAGTPGALSRRRFLVGVLVGGGAALLAACQASPSAGGSPTSTVGAATGSPVPASSPVASAAPSVTGVASADWQTQYNTWQTGAKSEGTIVVLGPPTPQLKTTLPQAFKTQFSVDMQYSGEATATAAPRLASERAGGVYSADIVIAGAGSMFQSIAGGGALSGNVMGMLAPLQPQLIPPDVTDTSKWRDNRLWFSDPPGRYVYRMTNFSNHAISVNTSVVKTTDITSWYDLVKPEYKGKIASFDPTINGPATSDLAYVFQKLGADFFQSLYVGQDVFIVRDAEQLGNSLAQGTYPIALFLEEQGLSDLVKQGLPVDKVPPPPETLPFEGGGFGFLGLLDHAPHPNAANVFVNWFLSKDGQQVFQDAQLQPSRRNDLDDSSYPSWFEDTIPVPGQQYFDVHEWDFALNVQPGIQKQMQSILKSA